MSVVLHQEEIFNASDFFNVNKQKGVKNFKFKKDFGSFYMDSFCDENGLLLSLTKIKFNKNVKFISSDSYPSGNFLAFNMGEDVFMSDKKQRYGIAKNLCYHGSFVGGKSGYGYYEKDKEYMHFHIILKDELYEKLFCQNEDNILHQNSNFSTFFNNRISATQHQILKQISNNPFSDDVLENLFLQSKAYALLYESAKIKPIKEHIYLSQKDRQKLDLAKNILLENLVNPPSIKELSKKVALNENKLKKGFKEIFGQPLYKFLAVRRLEVAKEHLSLGEMNISEAARLVGYRCQSHFSKKFVEHFGYGPKELKKQYYV